MGRRGHSDTLTCRAAGTGQAPAPRRPTSSSNPLPPLLYLWRFMWRFALGLECGSKPRYAGERFSEQNKKPRCGQAHSEGGRERGRRRLNPRPLPCTARPGPALLRCGAPGLQPLGPNTHQSAASHLPPSLSPSWVGKGADCF